MSKITVIGAGNVGATIANDLMIEGIASEIVLIDINRPKALGEALDIYQGVPYCAPAIVRSGDYPAASDSDIVIITSGMPRNVDDVGHDGARRRIPACAGPAERHFADHVAHYVDRIANAARRREKLCEDALDIITDITGLR